MDTPIKYSNNWNTHILNRHLLFAFKRFCEKMFLFTYTRVAHQQIAAKHTHTHKKTTKERKRRRNDNEDDGGIIVKHLAFLLDLNTMCVYQVSLFLSGTYTVWCIYVNPIVSMQCFCYCVHQRCIVFVYRNVLSAWIVFVNACMCFDILSVSLSTEMPYVNHSCCGHLLFSSLFFSPIIAFSHIHTHTFRSFYLFVCMYLLYRLQAASVLHELSMLCMNSHETTIQYYLSYQSVHTHTVCVILPDKNIQTFIFFLYRRSRKCYIPLDYSLVFICTNIIKIRRNPIISDETLVKWCEKLNWTDNRNSNKK